MESIRDPRSDPMAALYREGKTLIEIGAIFDLNRERVRQLIAKDHGLNRADGGKRKQAQLRKERRSSKQNDACLAAYGCSHDQYRSLEAGAVRKFTSQKHGAALRGIGWNLIFWEWWSIWQDSGKWLERGRGQGYAMCRKGDIGPYAVGNVFIGLATDNSSESQRKSKDLPVGVRKNRRYAGYSAHRMIDGVRLSLGSFPTPELAREAYLSASPHRQPVRRKTRA